MLNDLENHYTGFRWKSGACWPCDYIEHSPAGGDQYAYALIRDYGTFEKDVKEYEPEYAIKPKIDDYDFYYESVGSTNAEFWEAEFD